MSTDYRSVGAATSCAANKKLAHIGEPVGVPKGTFKNATEAYKAWLARQKEKGGSTLMSGSFHRVNKRRAELKAKGII